MDDAMTGNTLRPLPQRSSERSSADHLTNIADETMAALDASREW